MPSPDQILKRTAHRLWPPPRRPWLWSQGWRDLLFCHWAVPVEVLRAHVPRSLEIDVMDGSGWVSLVAFRMARVRPRWLPPLPPVSNFLELNLRTYVRYEDKPGVFFLSIHANKRVAVQVARWFSPLPYVFARMTLSRSNEGFRFHCDSADGRRDVNLVADYTPQSKVYATCQDSFSEWLLERYRLYVGNSSGDLIHAEVHHEPWFVQDVDLEIASSSLGFATGFELPRTSDRAHFSAGVDALAWSFEPEIASPKYHMDGSKAESIATDRHG
ncbi:MAG TPA: DUF2071 domain-containing protein [Gemmataceae bacterium]|nr:DUF2071 domain-containing protein [Gemmataceae bacterium]